jgi:hypothetical protein
MKTPLFAAVEMTAQSAGTAVAGGAGGNTTNRRLSGADHSLNKRMRVDSESEWHPRGKIIRRFLFLVLGLGLAISRGAAFGRTQTLPREDNIWGGYDHQPTQSEVTRQERAAGIAVSRQDEQLANDEVERIYDRLMRKTVARS